MDDILVMLRSFKSKGLAELWQTSSTAKIDAKMHKRVLRRLAALAIAKRPEDMNVGGFNFHPLRGFDPVRYSVHINGPWCVTFSMEDGDAVAIDFEQYH